MMNEKMNSDIIIYNNGEINLKVSVEKDTIWLRQDEIAQLFGKDRSVITRHINKIFKDEEVEEKSNVQKMHFPNSDKPVKRYSLDIVLAVGYRTNSAKAIKFRQWATEVLKNYISNGYAINSERITYQRFKELEHNVNELKIKVNNISKALEDKSLPPKQGIFYNGQVFDAYTLIADIIRSAKKTIILIDNYVDDTTLKHLAKRKVTVKATIYTKRITNILKQDVKKHNEQYPEVELKKLTTAHDRFLIVDNKTIYHFGASLKDAGKKWFAFSKLEMNARDIVSKL